MKKFIQFECHEYMDLYPTITTQSMEEDKAQEFADYMNSNYSGGTTRLLKVLTKEEAMAHVISQIKEIVDNPTVSYKDGHIDATDSEFIKNIITEFYTCYK